MTNLSKMKILSDSKIVSKIVSMTLLFSAATLTTSCDYLDVVPPEQASLADATKSHDRAMGFLFSCYGGIGVDNPCNYLGEVASSTDEYTLPYSWSADGMWDDYACNTASATNQSWVWGTTYQYIGQCLLFQKELEKMRGNFVSDAEKKEWLAESKFLIAYYHFATLRRYGPIPITDSYVAMDTPTDQYNGRFHFDYCVDWIAKLLDEAAEGLPAVRTKSEEWGRATSTMCKAVKARMLLYAASPLWNGKFPFPTWENKNFETPGYGKKLVSTTYDKGKWERALQANLEAFRLATGEGDRKLYDDLDFYKRNELKLPYAPGISDGDYPTAEDKAKQEDFLKRVMLMRYAVSTREGDGNKEYIWASWNMGFDITSRMPHHIIKLNNGNWQNGWSGVAPTLYTIEHFYTKDGKLPGKDKNFSPQAEWFTSANIAGRKDIINLNANREPRFYAWMAFDGGDYGSVFRAGQPLKLQMRNPEEQGFSTQFNRDNSVTGYLTQKYVHPKYEYGNAGSVNSGTAAPTILFRLAELYLNIAECYVALDDVDNALKYLNPIRERAGIPDLTKADVTADMTITDWVRNERFIELWNEGQRFFDVRRWCEGEKYFSAGKRMGLNAEVTKPTFEEFNVPTKPKHPFVWSNRMYLNPVFYNEVYKNPQMVQAPGY